MSFTFLPNNLQLNIFDFCNLVDKKTPMGMINPPSLILNNIHISDGLFIIGVPDKQISFIFLAFIFSY